MRYRVPGLALAVLAAAMNEIGRPHGPSTVSSVEAANAESFQTRRELRLHRVPMPPVVHLLEGLPPRSIARSHRGPTKPKRCNRLHAKRKAKKRRRRRKARA